MRKVFLLLLVAVGLTSCAAPQETALEYWKKRTRLDPSCAEYVESQYRSAAIKDFGRYRQAMKEVHPDFEKYSFDFSRVYAKLIRGGDQQATVAVKGQAATSEPGRTFTDVAEIDDQLDLKMEGWGWKIDYGWRLDLQAKTALSALAAAQERHLAQYKRYATSLTQVLPWFSPDPEVDLAITYADSRRWSGKARHKESNRVHNYESAGGGFGPGPRSSGP